MSTFISPSIDANVSSSLSLKFRKHLGSQNTIGNRVNFRDPPIPSDPIPFDLRRQIERYGSIEIDPTSAEWELQEILSPSNNTNSNSWGK